VQNERRVTMDVEDQRALEVLDARLRTMLPSEYQDSYEDMQPVPMRSAGLKYGPDGKVAWNEIWGSFCDLAMAGGPPHKGMLLEPGTRAAIDEEPERYAEVTGEIRRGVELVTELPAELSPTLGWVRVTCLNETMARWLLCAIVMENVAVRREHHMLDLPAAPSFQLEKEIKNVVTVIAKTCHYWLGHMPRAQQRAIASLFKTMDEESPAVEPTFRGDDPDEGLAPAAGIAQRVQQETGLAASTHRYAGWLGVECASARAAIWMMRALVVSNVLSRREGTVLFAPLNINSDRTGDKVVTSLARAHRLAAARGVL
jgi:sirohydrochlorin cobaltochelatase